jgi:hypothetical protein
LTASQSLLAFTDYTHPSWESSAHHVRICEALESVERGDINRLMITAPPRHTKSELASRRFPAWYLGRNPTKQVIGCSYNGDLATDIGRSVRNIVGEPEYRNVFTTEIAADSHAADRWQTTKGGVYIGAGVRGTVTGRGAHIGIIDDPLKNREEAESERIRESIWNWYTSTFYTRLMPGGAVVVVMCMTGDTPVLMEDGKEKQLRDIRPGDRVATYENGTVTASTVLNQRSNGDDNIFRIETRSGNIVRANERHPFLVDRNGDREWVRLKDLKPGMSLVAVKGATQPLATCDVFADEILSIEASGRAEVFDVQVERTENFIANGIVSHNTRWHDDDLGGRLLQQPGWTLLEMPAISGGEALWPEWYPLPTLREIESTIGPRDWSALYMQRPQADEGDYFKREWFRRYSDAPKHLNVYLTFDIAVSDDASADWSELGVWGIDPEGDIYALDWWRGQSLLEIGRASCRERV